MEALMEHQPGGMNGQPPMGGRPPRGEGRPPMGEVCPRKVEDSLEWEEIRTT